MSENDPVHDDWERFRVLTTMTNHWDRPGWAPGRRSFHWFLTLDSAALRDLAATCQERLRVFDCLDPVPADGLHLTVRRLAFTDEIDTAAVTTVVRRVAERCRGLPASGMRVGPLAGSSGAVRFPVCQSPMRHEDHRDLCSPGRDGIFRTSDVDHGRHGLLEAGGWRGELA